MFSTSDEYESALIMERRAQGRYDQPRSRWPLVMFAAARWWWPARCCS
jgi:hypothetical protein